MSYGDYVGHVFNLSQFSNKNDLLKEAAQIPQRTGHKTMTALGIDTARYQKSNFEFGSKLQILNTNIIKCILEDHQANGGIRNS